MKRKTINLHTDRKMALLLMVLFSALMLIFNTGLALATNGSAAELSILLRSDYDYSVTTQKGFGTNDYYLFNAGISFASSRDSNMSFNADVVMQVRDSGYSNEVAWNADVLSCNGVAVSEGIARSNKLHIGDIIYSKHNVDGTIHEYTIEQILPEVLHVRLTSHRSFTNGVIVMGYDELYEENISHSLLTFTRMPFNDLASIDGMAVQNIAYRDDEVAFVVQSLFPYWTVFLLLSVLVSIISCYIHSKGVSHNFRRLITLGFERETLNKAFLKYTFLPGCISVLISLLLSELFCFTTHSSTTESLIFGAVAIIELAMLWLSALYFRGRLWRR